MVLVDSSVWIDYLGIQSSKFHQKLEALIQPHNQAVITGVIFQEVLQGIRNSHSFQLTQKLLGRLPILIPNIETHLQAAGIFKMLSSKGKTSSTIDVLISALAIQNGIPLFTLDAGFHVITENTNLKLFS